jgi:hypothetical protein
VSQQNDLDNAEWKGEIREWRRSIDELIQHYDGRIGELEKCQKTTATNRKLLIAYSTLAAVAMFALCFGVFSLRDPATGAAILESLIKLPF